MGKSDKDGIFKNLEVVAEQWEDFLIARKMQIRKAREAKSIWRKVHHYDGIREEWFDMMPRIHYYLQIPDRAIFVAAIYFGWPSISLRLQDLGSWLSGLF